MHQFWSSWTLSEMEQKYIAVLKQALPSVLDEHVVAVYVGGSFVRREIIDGSDLDLYVFVDVNDVLEPLIAKTDGMIIDGVHLQVHIYSIDELEHQRHVIENTTNRRMPPAVLLRELKHYSLFYGSSLDLSKHELMTDDDYLRKFLPVLRRRIDDDWGKKDAERLRFIAKQVFFLVHHEMKLRGDESHFSRTKLLERFKEQDHILHLCDDVRKNPSLFIDRKNDFLSQVSLYLDRVEKEFL